MKTLIFLEHAPYFYLAAGMKANLRTPHTVAEKGL